MKWAEATIKALDIQNITDLVYHISKFKDWYRVVFVQNKGEYSFDIYKYNDSDILYIENLYVDIRKLGTGSKVLTLFENIGRLMDISELDLFCRKEGFERKWYSKLGYKYCSFKDNENIWMNKHLMDE